MSMVKKYKKILVINIFGIGDVLFSTPILGALKKNMPGISIDFMCNERCQHVLRNNKNIDDIIVFEKDRFREAFKESKIEFIKKMYAFVIKIKRKKYDLAIDLSLGYQFSLLLMLLGVRRRIGFNYRDRGKFLTEKVNMNGFNDKHATEYYTDIIKSLHIENNTEGAFELSSSQGEEAWATSFVDKKELETKTLVGIAPGGGNSWGKYALYRRWSPANFSYVAEKISGQDKDVFFLIFGSSEEKALSQTIKERLGERALNLCGELSLPQSIALIKKCKLVLCNDGGLLHIAVSQGVRTVSIFGPVDDKVYGPYPPSEKHKVVKAENVKCRPCYRSFRHKICETHECLKKIDKDYVLKLAKEILR